MAEFVQVDDEKLEALVKAISRADACRDSDDTHRICGPCWDGVVEGVVGIDRDLRDYPPLKVY